MQEGVPGDVQRSERCDGSKHGVWGDVVPGEQGKGQHRVPPGTMWCTARGHDRAEGPQHGVTHGRGSPAPPNPHGALTPSVHAGDHTCMATPMHTHTCASPR